MSTEIHDGPVKANQFYGGKERGLCIQITSHWKSSDFGAGRFVQGEYDDVVACAEAIVAFDAENKLSHLNVDVATAERAVIDAGRRWLAHENGPNLALLFDAIVALNALSPETPNDR